MSRNKQETVENPKDLIDRIEEQPEREFEWIWKWLEASDKYRHPKPKQSPREGNTTDLKATSSPSIGNASSIGYPLTIEKNPNKKE